MVKKKRKGRVMMSFKVGDSVRIKEGMTHDSFDLSGWQGWVTGFMDVDGVNMLLIDFDSETMSSIPLEYIEDVDKEMWEDWTKFYLPASEVESVAPRDTEEDAKQMRKDLFKAECTWGLGGLLTETALQAVAPVVQEIENFIGLHKTRDEAMMGGRDFRGVLRQQVEINNATDTLLKAVSELKSVLLNESLDIYDLDDELRDKARRGRGE